MPAESTDPQPSRRAFLARFAGAAFAVPVIASFAFDGVAQASEKSDHRQGHPNQTSGNQGHPKQCHPNQTSGNQGYPKQGHPNQTTGNQTTGNHGHPKQCHPNQGNPNQTLPDS
jgi:hypothetical protein